MASSAPGDRRKRDRGETLADDATPLAIIGGIILWTLRLTLAPPSAIVGFRRWITGWAARQ